ncbi:MAG: hypothetical protein ABW073_07330 [Acidimicrobiia bacterium]
MAVVFVQEWNIEPGDHATANYDAVAERIGRDVRPDGLVIHTAGFDDELNVFRILDVWESEAQAQAFIDGQLMPVVMDLMNDADSGFDPPHRQSFYELHDVIHP